MPPPVEGFQVLPSSSVQQVAESTPVSWDSKVRPVVWSVNRIGSRLFGAAAEAAVGGLGRHVGPLGGGGGGAVVEGDLVGGQVGLVHRRAGLPARPDRGLTGVVGVGEGRRGLVGREAGGRVGAGCGVGRLVHEVGLRGVAVAERGEGDHAHGVVTAGRGQHDLLGVGAGGRGAHHVAGLVEHVDVEVGAAVGPLHVDLQLVGVAVARGGVDVQREVVARGRHRAVGGARRLGRGVGRRERATGPGDRTGAVGDSALVRSARCAGGADAQDEREAGESSSGDAGAAGGPERHGASCRSRLRSSEQRRRVPGVTVVSDPWSPTPRERPSHP